MREYEQEFKIGCRLRMVRHKETMHGEVTNKCDQCDYQSKIRENFMKHKKFVHLRKNIGCSQCSFTATYPSLLEHHKKSIHEGIKWTCDVCERKFVSPRSLRRHKVTNHSQTVHKRSCNSCNFSVETTAVTKSVAKLKNHMDIIHGKIVYECDQCPYTSKSSLSMKHHMNRHKTMLKLAMSPLVCEQCSYTAKQKGHLDIHIRSKHKGEVLKCDLCDYNATQLSNLTRHKRSKHTDMLTTPI